MNPQPQNGISSSGQNLQPSPIYYQQICKGNLSTGIQICSGSNDGFNDQFTQYCSIDNKSTQLTCLQNNGYMNSNLVSITNLSSGIKTVNVSNFERDIFICQTNAQTYDQNCSLLYISFTNASQFNSSYGVVEYCLGSKTTGLQNCSSDGFQTFDIYSCTYQQTTLNCNGIQGTSSQGSVTISNLNNGNTVTTYSSNLQTDYQNCSTDLNLNQNCTYLNTILNITGSGFIYSDTTNDFTEICSSFNPSGGIQNCSQNGDIYKYYCIQDKYYNTVNCTGLVGTITEGQVSITYLSNGTTLTSYSNSNRVDVSACTTDQTTFASSCQYQSSYYFTQNQSSSQISSNQQTDFIKIGDVNQTQGASSLSQIRIQFRQFFFYAIQGSNQDATNPGSCDPSCDLQADKCCAIVKIQQNIVDNLCMNKQLVTPSLGFNLNQTSYFVQCANQNKIQGAFKSLSILSGFFIALITICQAI